MKKLTGHVLVVDDDAEMQLFLRRSLSADGHRVTTSSSGSEALRLLQSASVTEGGDYDLILSDINMPEMNGLDFIKRVKELPGDLPVIMITAFGSIESAVEAMKAGAFDYMTKPLKVDELYAIVNRTLNYRNLEKENLYLRGEVRQTWSLGDMIGKSLAMQKIFDLIRRVAQVTANVLILGESGTGKEMVARAIHNGGPRAAKPFIAINCAAIPEDLLESELFGHAKGSFTGAIAQKRGLLEEADGGTIFLDEIGDMDMALQAKLLRVIQERKIRPVGQNAYRDIDVRIIAATHRDLKNLIVQGKFREDLYFRLSVIPIFIPPLRERPEDIPLFAEHFLKKYALQNNSKARGFSREAMSKLVSLSWEGNVRQLENTIERAVILADGPMIEESHFLVNQTSGPSHKTPVVGVLYELAHEAPRAEAPRAEAPTSAAAGVAGGGSAQATSSMEATGPQQGSSGQQQGPRTGDLSSGVMTFKEMEKRCLEQALAKAGGKKEKAAQILGISRKTLYRKEKEFGL